MPIVRFERHSCSGDGCRGRDTCTEPFPAAPLTRGLTCCDTCLCPCFSWAFSASRPESSPEGPSELPQDPASSHQPHLQGGDPDVFIPVPLQTRLPCQQWSYLPTPLCPAGGQRPLLVSRLSRSLPVHASVTKSSVAVTLWPGPSGKPLPTPPAHHHLCQAGTRPSRKVQGLGHRMPCSEPALFFPHLRRGYIMLLLSAVPLSFTF